MADEEKKEEPVKAKKGGAMKTIGIGLIAGLLIGGGVTFFLKGSDPPPAPPVKGEKVAEGKAAAAEDGSGDEFDDEMDDEAEEEDEEEVVPEGEEEASAKRKNIVIFDLEPFVVNLADTPDVRYLKVTIKLDLMKEKYIEQLTERIAQIRDTLLILLSSKEFESVRTVEGKMELRDEILQRVNSIFRRRKVRNAYFTDFVTQ